MTKADVESYRKRLLALTDRLNTSLDLLRDEAMRGRGGESSGGLSDTPVHPADLGTDQSDQEVEVAILGNEEHILGEVRAALTRIEAGTFGRCEGCGRKIARERLNAIPYARRCVRCEQAVEKEEVS